VHDLAGRTVFVLPLFHPAAALRTPSVLDTLREHFEQLPRLLAEPLPSLGGPDEDVEDAESGERPPTKSQLDLFA
jgi:DNA polymerase